VIKQDYIGRNRRGGSGNLLELSLADQRCRLRTISLLRKFARDLGARARCEAAEFVEGLFPTEIG
jgi:hypothetical protein